MSCMVNPPDPQKARWDHWSQGFTSLSPELLRECTKAVQLDSPEGL